MTVQIIIRKLASLFAVLGVLSSIGIGYNTNAGIGILSGISVIITCLLLYGFGALIESVRNIEDILSKKEGNKSEEH